LVSTGRRALDYSDWSETCDTLHAHTQVLGKIAAKLAPPEPGFQHVALRLTARGWETAPLPAPEGSGALVVCLDLLTHMAVVEHSGGGERRTPLAPNRSVGEVARAVLAAAGELGGDFEIDPTPQEVPWSVPLDEDDLHSSYDIDQVARYFEQATRASLALTAFRAPYDGPRTPVNAWWGSFDLAVSLFADHPVREVAVGWWPGDARYPLAAYYGYFKPSEGRPAMPAEPSAARWDDGLGEFVLDEADTLASGDPHATVLAFARSIQAAAGIR
jgi:hypothetical protein